MESRKLYLYQYIGYNFLNGDIIEAVTSQKRVNHTRKFQGRGLLGGLLINERVLSGASSFYDDAGMADVPGILFLRRLTSCSARVGTCAMTHSYKNTKYIKVLWYHIIIIDLPILEHEI